VLKEQGTHKPLTLAGFLLSLESSQMKKERKL